MTNSFAYLVRVTVPLAGALVACGGSPATGGAGGGFSGGGAGGRPEGGSGGSGAVGTGGAGVPAGAAFHVIDSPSHSIVRPGDDPKWVNIGTHATFARAGGSVVFGSSYAVVTRPGDGAPLVEGIVFRWTAQTGTVSLHGSSPDPLFTYANVQHASDDGSVMIGTFGVGSIGEHTFRWTQASGMVDVGTLPDGDGLTFDGADRSGSTLTGSVRIGFSARGGGARWTAAEGLTNLGMLASYPNTSAAGISGDGAVVFGVAGPGADGGAQPFRWTAETGMVGLGRAPGARSCGVTGDGVARGGGAITGTCDIAQQTIFFYRWTEADGMVRLGEPGGSVRAISDDGAVVIGDAAIAGSTRTPFRWTKATGLVLLDGAALGCSSYATTIADPAPREGPVGMSDDGSVVVGSCGNRGFLWTTGAPPTALLPPPEHSQVIVTDVSADGAAVVGSAYASSGVSNREAVIWDAAGNVRTVRAVLEAAGIDLAGFRLGATNSRVNVLAGGRVLFGDGTTAAGQRRAWVARLP